MMWAYTLLKTITCSGPTLNLTLILIHVDDWAQARSQGSFVLSFLLYFLSSSCGPKIMFYHQPNYSFLLIWFSFLPFSLCIFLSVVSGKLVSTGNKIKEILFAGKKSEMSKNSDEVGFAWENHEDWDHV